ncbi:jg14061 [Pararge aegeria aegeria]|uniref:Jg14061 protein n=1 Tax=Pararge aegeria aegeria TaxID=348720 RepID=A0A8S4SJC2_9NEOP|nr:jg14061 [Pararge aegeria aegeria]
MEKAKFSESGLLLSVSRQTNPPTILKSSTYRDSWNSRRSGNPTQDMGRGAKPIALRNEFAPEALGPQSPLQSRRARTHV